MFTTVDQVKITLLIENSPCYDSYYEGAFGASFWIETTAGKQVHRLLFDVGPLSDTLLRNAQKMKIDLTSADAIALSHNHFDHTKALSGVLDYMKKEIPIYAHKDIFRRNFILKPAFKEYGLLGKNSRTSLEALGAQFHLTEKPIEISPGVLFSGTIHRQVAFEKTGGIESFNGSPENPIPDEILDDATIGIQVKNKGLVLVTGCSHAGPVNIVKHFKEITEINTLYGIMGGFHLLEADRQRIQKTVDAFIDFNPSFVAPTHCTGLRASAAFLDAFDEKFKECHAGDTIIIKAKG